MTENNPYNTKHPITLLDHVPGYKVAESGEIIYIPSSGVISPEGNSKEDIAKFIIGFQSNLCDAIKKIDADLQDGQAVICLRREFAMAMVGSDLHLTVLFCGEKVRIEPVASVSNSTNTPTTAQPSGPS